MDAPSLNLVFPCQHRPYRNTKRDARPLKATVACRLWSPAVVVYLRGWSNVRDVARAPAVLHWRRNTDDDDRIAQW